MYDFFFVFSPQYLPRLLQGAWVTIELSLISMFLAIPAGMLVAIGRMSSAPILRTLLNSYVEIFRNIPLIVQLLVIYFSLPSIGISFPAFWAGVLGLTLNLVAYLSEVFRASLMSVGSGQREAGESLGLSNFSIYCLIILPQALRIALPTVGGYFISLLKDCSLVSFIAVNELLRQGSMIIASTFQSMQTYLLVAIIYFFMSFVASRLVKRLETSLTPAYLREVATASPKNLK